MEFQTCTVTSSDGVELAVRESGNPAGAELVMIHGFSQCQLVFSRQVQSALLQKFRLITYDLRGHGESGKPLDAASYTDGRHWADDLKAVIDGLHLRRPVLLGWSLGGRVICQYVELYGDAGIAGINFVAARTVADPAIPVHGEGGQYLRAMGSLQTEMNIAATASFIRCCVNQPLAAQEFELMLAYNMMVSPQIRAATMAWPGNFSQVLKRIAVPTLITHGTQDRITLPCAAELTASKVSGSRLSWYDDIGHTPSWEAPDRFNQELADFITEVN